MVKDPGISVRDPRWVGAWWLGFLFFGGAAVVVAIPIFCFPRHLKGRRQIEGAEPQKKGVAEDEKKTTVVADDLKGNISRTFFFNAFFSSICFHFKFSIINWGITIHMQSVFKYI